MSPQNSKEFLALQEKWYKKLKKSGFEDVETPDGKLKEWDSNFFRQQYDGIKVKAKERYYQLAGQFLHSHRFKNRLHRKIFKLHSQGFNKVEILKLINTEDRQDKLSLQNVRTILKHLINKMLKNHARL